LLMTVPDSVLLLTPTLKVMVATLAVVAEASAFMAPGVVLPGALINMPACSGETPAEASATAAPFRVVVFGT
jgi:hypothetical protein